MRSKRSKLILVATLILGITIGQLFSVSAWAKSGNEYISAMFNNIKIVVDGTQIQPKDANGNPIEPFIVNGTTYLPVRAVANAVGKEVYWDGPNWTVFLGSMNGALQSPSLKLEDAVSIGADWAGLKRSSILTDNYHNTYSIASHTGGTHIPYTWETLLNMKYSKFKGTAYIPLGTTSNAESSFRIEADGQIIFSSPTMSKTSPPVKLDVNITGCNDFKIIVINGGDESDSIINFGDCGFYQ